MKELLLIGVGRMGRPYVDAARRLGIRVRAVEAANRAEDTGPLVDELVVCAGDADEAWAAAAYEAATARRPDGVLAFSEPHVMAAALVADVLRLPGPSLHAATLSRNKALQRARFAAAGVRQPEFLVTTRLADARPWVLPRLPVVVKPLSGAGSAGVELIPDAESFTGTAVERAGERPLLVETAIAGEEYSWEALVRDGTVWFSNVTRKETTGAPDFVELSHRAGATLPPDQMRQVQHLGAQIVGALGMRSGLVHLEFRLAADGPTVMEVAVRTPGDFIMEILNRSHGIDWFEMAVRLALELPLPPPPVVRASFAASYLPVADPGTVVRIVGLDEVSRHPDVVVAEVEVAPGDVVPPARSSADRVGWVLVDAATPAARDEALDYVRSTLRVVTKGASPSPLWGSPPYFSPKIGADVGGRLVDQG